MGFKILFWGQKEKVIKKQKEQKGQALPFEW